MERNTDFIKKYFYFSSTMRDMILSYGPLMEWVNKNQNKFPVPSYNPTGMEVFDKMRSVIRNVCEFSNLSGITDEQKGFDAAVRMDELFQEHQEKLSDEEKETLAINISEEEKKKSPMYISSKLDISVANMKNEIIKYLSHFEADPSQKDLDQNVNVLICVLQIVENFNLGRKCKNFSMLVGMLYLTERVTELCQLELKKLSGEEKPQKIGVISPYFENYKEGRQPIIEANNEYYAANENDKPPIKIKDLKNMMDCELKKLITGKAPY